MVRLLARGADPMIGAIITEIASIGIGGQPGGLALIHWVVKLLYRALHWRKMPGMSSPTWAAFMVIAYSTAG